MIKTLKGFTKNIFILIFLFTSFGTTLPMQPLSMLTPEEEARYQPIIEKYDDQYINGLLKQYGPKYVDNLLKDYEGDFLKNLEFSDEDKEEKIQQFNNTLLATIPIAKTPVPISIGIYKGDIVKGAFLATDVTLDWYLYKKLDEFYTKHILTQINRNGDELLSKLAKVGPDLNHKDLTLRNLAQTELLEFIQQEYSLAYKKIVTNPFLIKYLLIYFASTELSRILKNQFLGQRDIKSFGIFFKKLTSSINNSNKLRFLMGKPIAISSFIESFFLFSRPMVSDMSYGTFLFNELFKLQGWQPEFLDDYWVLLIKEISILLLSVKKIDSNIYQKTWFAHLRTHWDQFIPFLKEYQTLKAGFKGKRNSDEEFYKAEKQLKEFIAKGHKISFRSWLTNKNAAFTKNEFYVNLAINIPSYCLAGKAGVQHGVKYFLK